MVGAMTRTCAREKSCATYRRLPLDRNRECAGFTERLCPSKLFEKGNSREDESRTGFCLLRRTHDRSFRRSIGKRSVPGNASTKKLSVVRREPVPGPTRRSSHQGNNAR